jgi:shikimate dehydrogenase
VAADDRAPVFGVVGSPIDHSRSPALHLAAYAALGLDARYDRAEVREGGLRDHLEASGPERRGFSVTMPLKREAWAAAARRDRAAELTGAANTLVRADDGGFEGANTDVGGIVDAVRGVRTEPIAHVVVLGSGATASSAVVAASELGASAVTLAVRSPERAVGTAELARSIGLDADVRALADLAGIPADVVISTLPGGTILDASPERASADGALLLDAAYSPWPGGLVAHWFERDAPVVHGLAMLVHQAARQVRLFARLDEAQWRRDRPVITDAMFRVVGLDPSGRTTPAR